MLFYCLDFAYDELKNTSLPTWNRDGHHLFTSHVMLVPMEEQAHLYFINDASGFTIILRYGLEDEINVDYEMFREITTTFMKEMDLPEDLIGYYFSIFPKFDVSADYNERHIEEIIEWLLKNKNHLLEHFKKNTFIQRDAMKILSESIIDKWFGEVIGDAPRNIMNRQLEKELGSVREYYASNM